MIDVGRRIIDLRYFAERFDDDCNKFVCFFVVVFLLLFFLIQFYVPFQIISLIETSQSIGGAKQEYPGKNT